MPSHDPRKRPGRIALLTSAITVTVIVLGVTPISGLVRFAPLHAAVPALTVVVVLLLPRSPPPVLLLLPLQAVAITTTANASHPIRNLITRLPGSVPGRSVGTNRRGCRCER